MAAATMDKRPLSPDIDAVSSGPVAKRSKTEPEAQTHENDEFALARLRCLGVDVDETEDALSAVVAAAAADLNSPPLEKTGKGKRNLSSQEEKELRRERGELLLKLFREVPWLADSASARRAEKNQERAQMWEVITQKVNDNFGDKLEYLSVDKVKKLLTYYKKKDDGSYDNIKNSIPLDEDNEGDDNNDVSTVSESRSESGDDEASAPKGVVLIEEKADQQLMEFLASMTSSAPSSIPLKDGSKQDESTPHTVASTESHYQLKKDRHDFVVAQAEHYMERMCFDNSSRSAAVNAERHNMWIKITHKANEKFASQLGPLGVEQAKKLYSNCKRRRRVKAEQAGGGRGDDQQLTHSSRGNSTTPDENNDLSSLMDDVNDYDPPAATNFEELIRGLDRSVEIDDLKKQLREREAEIVRLKKVVEEQAADYQSRTKSILEIFKVALDKKVAEDIRLLAA